MISQFNFYLVIQERTKIFKSNYKVLFYQKMHLD